MLLTHSSFSFFFFDVGYKKICSFLKRRSAETVKREEKRKKKKRGKNRTSLEEETSTQHVEGTPIGLPARKRTTREG